MSDNKKYYYLKLKEDFFDSEDMIVLESMPDGILYSNILLKLYLRSLKNNGRLMYRNAIPYDSVMLSQLVRQPVAVVEKAVSIFKQIGLIEILENGAIYMLEIENFIGSSSTEADRIRKLRARVANEKENLLQAAENDCTNVQKTGCTNVQQMNDECTANVHQRIENRDKRIEIKNNIISSPKEAIAYASTIELTEKQFKMFATKCGSEDLAMQIIEEANDWREKNPTKAKKTKSISRFLGNWLKKYQEDQQAMNNNSSGYNKLPDYVSSDNWIPPAYEGQ